MIQKFQKVVKWICFLFFRSLLTALQIRASQRSITTSLWPLTAHMYYVMITATRGISKKSFFVIFRSSRMQIFFKTGVIGNFAIFAGKPFCWTLFFVNLVPKETQHRWFLQKLLNYYVQLFLWNTSRNCFCQFDKATVQWWAFADLLFLIKNKICGMASTKKVCRSAQSRSFTNY